MRSDDQRPLSGIQTLSAFDPLRTISPREQGQRGLIDFRDADRCGLNGIRLMWCLAEQKGVRVLHHRLPVLIAIVALSAALVGGFETPARAQTQAPAPAETPMRVLVGLGLDGACEDQPASGLKTLTDYARRSTELRLSMHPWPDPDCAAAYFAVWPEIRGRETPYGVYLSAILRMSGSPDCRSAALEGALQDLDRVIGRVRVDDPDAYLKKVPEAAYLKGRMLAACGSRDEAWKFYETALANGIAEADIGMRSLRPLRPQRNAPDP